MIEVRNLKGTVNEGKKDEQLVRIHIKQNWDGVSVDDHCDSDSGFSGFMCGKIKNSSFIFDNFESAEKFYDAFKALLPDSDAQNAVIDHKDFE